MIQGRNRKFNAYIYPNTIQRENRELYNPYIHDMIGALETDFIFLNKDDRTNKGVLNLLKYLFRTRYYFLNWIEDLPDKKFGRIQSLIFILFVLLCRITGKKIVWTVHNRRSHQKAREKWKAMLFRFLAQQADYLLTHASRGIDYINELSEGASKKTFYFPHPIKPIENQVFIANVTGPDILIWGTIAEYKAVDRFLDYLYKNSFENRYKIRIIGKITTGTYATKILSYQNKNIQIEDRFADKDELAILVRNARIVLFTYEDEYVLSSGALMDTLAMYGNIIGPGTGAFHDLETAGIIKTFSGYAHLLELIDKEMTESRASHNPFIDQFISDHTWQKYAEACTDFILPDKPIKSRPE